MIIRAGNTVGRCSSEVRINLFTTETEEPLLLLFGTESISLASLSQTHYPSWIEKVEKEPSQ